MAGRVVGLVCLRTPVLLGEDRGRGKRCGPLWRVLCQSNPTPYQAPISFAIPLVILLLQKRKNGVNCRGRWVMFDASVNQTQPRTQAPNIIRNPEKDNRVVSRDPLSEFGWSMCARLPACWKLCSPPLGGENLDQLRRNRHSA